MAEPIEAEGIILSNALYSLPEVTKRLGLTSAAIRGAKRDGLPVMRIGHAQVVLGESLISFVRERQEPKP